MKKQSMKKTIRDLQGLQVTTLRKGLLKLCKEWNEVASEIDRKFFIYPVDTYDLIFKTHGDEEWTITDATQAPLHGDTIISPTGNRYKVNSLYWQYTFEKTHTKVICVLNLS